MKQRKSVLAAGLALTMLVNGAAMLAAVPAAKAVETWDAGVDPYGIDWVVKYEENFDQAVAEPEEWVRDTYEVQKDEFWGDFGYAEQYHYADDHNGASLEMALEEFGAYRKSYSFGEDDWLTIESYARNAGDDPDAAPEEGGKFIINGDGKAVMVVKKHTDAAVIGSSRPLPSTYRLEVTVKNIDVGGLNLDENGKDVAMDGTWGPWTREEPNEYVEYEGKRVNGYFKESGSLDSGPWVTGDATTQNGMYFLGIVDYGNPRPQNNTFIHYHRKLAFDTDNNGPRPWSEVYDNEDVKKVDGSRYISMLFLDAYKQPAYTSGCKFFSYTSKNGGTPEEGAAMLDKYIPGEEYTFAVIRTPQSYTMEVTGNFYYAGQHTYSYTKPHVDEEAPGTLSGWTYHFNQTVEELQGMIPPTADDEIDYNGHIREDWPADAVYPDYFYIGIPHINFYSGTAEFTNITLRVPEGSPDDPAMSADETVKVEGVTAESKIYDGKAPEYDVQELLITDKETGEDLTEELKAEVELVWYKGSRALSIAPKDVGEYTLKAVVEYKQTSGEKKLYRGVQEIPVTIEKATVEISVPDQSALLGGEKPVFDYVVTGLAEGEKLVREPVVDTSKIDMQRGGTYPVTVSGARLPNKTAGNYEPIVYKDGVMTVVVNSSPMVPTGPSSGSSGSAGKTTKPKEKTTTNKDGSVTVKTTDSKGVIVETTTRTDGDVSAKITLPKRTESATVTIPAKNLPAGTVAMIVREDGTEEVVRKSIVTEEGVRLSVTGDATVKLVNNSTRFDDVPADDWAASAVDYVSSRQLFQGTGGNRFTPAEKMTRGMLLTVMARLDGADTTPANGEEWFARGAAWAVEKNVSNGQNPNEDITRQELAMLLWRYAEKPETKGSLEEFKDAGEVASFAEIPMRWAVEKGIIGGKDGKRLDPYGTASRAEVAAMLERFVKATV